MADNVFNTTGDISPIFVLGKDSIEKQKEIEKLKVQAIEEQKKGDIKKSEISDAKSSLDNLNYEKGKEIKLLLSSSGQNQYNYYDKSNFKDKCKNLKNQNWQSLILDDAKKNVLKKQKEASFQDKVPEVLNEWRTLDD